MNEFIRALERAEKLIAERNAEIEILRMALRKIFDNPVMCLKCVQIAKEALGHSSKEAR